jgi:hypothetical protein
MLRWIALVGICVACRLNPAALAIEAQTAPPAATIVWDGGFRPIIAEKAAYPRAAALADGRLLVTFARTTPTAREIACVVSRDGGKTWTDYRRICAQPRGVDLDNAFPLQLADGTIVVAYRRHEREHRRFRLEISASRDTERWTALATIAAASQGVWEPFLLALPNGELQAYYASEEGCCPSQRIEMRTSPDNGKSWSAPRTVAQKRGSRDGMPGVVRIAGQELLAVFEAQDLAPFRFVIRAVRSPDLGRTWSGVRELVYCPQTPDAARWAAGAPSIVGLRDGRLMVSFQSDEEIDRHSSADRRNPSQPNYDYLSHTHLAFVTSADRGKSWSDPVRLLGGPNDPANWNALYAGSDGLVLALSNHRGRLWVRTGVAGR